MTNPTLSERLLRAALTNIRTIDDSSALLHNFMPEILQALDDNDVSQYNFMRQRILNLEARIGELESDNERYRATIVQLEKERKEAVERVQNLETEQRGAANALRVANE